MRYVAAYGTIFLRMRSKAAISRRDIGSDRGLARLGMDIM